jgi:hypothetical protein
MATGRQGEAKPRLSSAEGEPGAFIVYMFHSFRLFLVSDLSPGALGYPPTYYRYPSDICEAITYSAQCTALQVIAPREKMHSTVCDGLIYSAACFSSHLLAPFLSLIKKEKRAGFITEAAFLLWSSLFLQGDSSAWHCMVSNGQIRGSRVHCSSEVRPSFCQVDI